jgi:hypothetical protein
MLLPHSTQLPPRCRRSPGGGARARILTLGRPPPDSADNRYRAAPLGAICCNGPCGGPPRSSLSHRHHPVSASSAASPSPSAAAAEAAAAAAAAGSTSAPQLRRGGLPWPTGEQAQQASNQEGCVYAPQNQHSTCLYVQDSGNGAWWVSQNEAQLVVHVLATLKLPFC